MILLVAKSQLLLMLMWCIAHIHNWTEMLNIREKMKCNFTQGCIPQRLLGRPD